MKSATKNEAKKRVEQALEQIEMAQQLVGDACAKVSSVEGLVSQWEEIGELHEKLKAAWHRLNLRSEDEDLDLDQYARKKFEVKS